MKILGIILLCTTFIVSAIGLHIHSTGYTSALLVALAVISAVGSIACHMLSESLDNGKSFDEKQLYVIEDQYHEPPAGEKEKWLTLATKMRECDSVIVKGWYERDMLSDILSALGFQTRYEIHTRIINARLASDECYYRVWRLERIPTTSDTTSQQLTHATNKLLEEIAANMNVGQSIKLHSAAIANMLASTLHYSGYRPICYAVGKETAKTAIFVVNKKLIKDSSDYEKFVKPFQVMEHDICAVFDV